MRGARRQAHLCLWLGRGQKRAGVLGPAIMAALFWTEERKKEVRAYRDWGLAYYVIARAMGISYGSVATGVRRHMPDLIHRGFVGRDPLEPPRPPKPSKRRRGGRTRVQEHTWSDADKARISELLNGNPPLTYTQLAREFGCSKNAIAGIIDRNGLHRRKVALKPVISFPEKGHCLYGHGDPFGPGFRWCGAKAISGRAWCPEHAAVCYQRSPNTAGFRG